MTRARPVPKADRGLDRIALAVVLLIATLLYFRNLGSAPLNIGVDEARFTVHAQSLSATSRDIDGARLPLFFHIINPLSPDNGSDIWWQPMLFYLVAAVFRVAPVSEAAVRLPIACIALLNVWLIGQVARRLFGNGWYGVVAAGILALTPAHFMFGRQALDYFCTLPFVLLWLWRLIAAVDDVGARYPVAIGVILGTALYSHISSWILMPVFLIVTLIVFWRLQKPLASSVWLSAGFGMMVLPVLPWLWLHPGMIHDMITNYKLAGGLRLAERVDLYWDAFNPSYLFFSGGSNPMFATRRAGVLPLAAAVLLPLGAVRTLRRDTIVGRVILAGFLLSPVAVVAALPEDAKYYTPRGLLLVPFAVLICTSGVEWLVESGAAHWRSITRIVAAVLVVSVPFQFAGFAAYYFGPYQTWSAPRFDPLNLRAVAASVSAADAAATIPTVYLSEDVDEPQAEQWLFYLLAGHHLDLWRRSRHLQLRDFDTTRMQPGSYVVLEAHHPGLSRLLSSGRCSLVAMIDDVGGSPAAAILRRE